MWDPLGRIRPRQTTVRQARVVRHLHDARVPTIQVLYANVLRRYLSHDLLESCDGLEVVRDVELSDDDGFEIVSAFRTDFGGDHEDATPCGAGDEVLGAGHRRGAAIFDAWAQRRGEYDGTEREERACLSAL